MLLLRSEVQHHSTLLDSRESTWQHLQKTIDLRQLAKGWGGISATWLLMAWMGELFAG